MGRLAAQEAGGLSRVVPAAEILAHLWMGDGFEPIYHRALIEAGLVRRSSVE
jgi:hypothetical protein